MSEKRESLRRRLSEVSLALAGGVLVLDPVVGTATVISKVMSLGATLASGAELDSLETQLGSIEARVADLERTNLPTLRVQDPALSVLVATFDAAIGELFGTSDCEDFLAASDLSHDDYAEAAEELEALGLITLQGSGNSPTGIARTVLAPAAFFRVAPVLSDVDVVALGHSILRTVEGLGPVRTRAVLDELDAPLAIFDQVVLALVEDELLEGSGSGGYDYGSYMDIEITPLGRRVARGDDPLY